MLDYSEASDVSDFSDEEEEIDSTSKGQSYDRRREDENKKQRKESKDFEQCPFEMIDNVAKTMKKLKTLWFVIFLIQEHLSN